LSKIKDQRTTNKDQGTKIRDQGSAIRKRWSGNGAEAFFLLRLDWHDLSQALFQVLRYCKTWGLRGLGWLLCPWDRVELRLTLIFQQAR
jgi:hypothetical protein